MESSEYEEQPKMLSMRVIDRLFDRLSGIYGREFYSKYEHIDHEIVKQSWAIELYPFENNLLRIKWAIDNLPERCPNAIQFRELCWRAPNQNPEQLPALPPPPNIENESVKQLAKIWQKTDKPFHDRRVWQVVLDKRPTETTAGMRQMARDGLGVNSEIKE